MPHFPNAFYKKSRSTWYVQLDGKQYNLNTYFADRPTLGPDDVEAAQERCVELKQILRSQSTPEPVPSQAVVSLLDRFLDWVKDHRAPRTYEWYQWRLQSFADFIGRDLTVNQLKQFHLDEWLKSNTQWANGTKHGMAQAVMAAVRWATKKGYADKNPISGYDKPPMGKRNTVITPDEFQTILSAVPIHEFRDLLTTAWETGCRPQEALAVEARHVDADHARWVFPPEESKGEKWPRVVYLNAKAMAITKRLMEQYPDGKLFRNSQGRPWKRWAVNCAFTRIKKKLGKRYCLYNLRHSWATHALAGGLDALTVAVLLGHRDPSMLARTYQHLNQNASYLHDAVNKLVMP